MTSEEIMDLSDRARALLAAEDPMHPIGCATWEQEALYVLELAADALKALAARPASDGTSCPEKAAVDRMREAVFDALEQAAYDPAIQAVDSDGLALQGGRIHFRGSFDLDGFARAMLAQTSCPEGWRLVPETPTEAMIEAGGGKTVNTERWDDPSFEPPEIYRAMLSAAPPPPERGPDAKTPQP